ncbi:hypothetical protein Tco_0639353 [Tanacetum coccineum]
MARETLPPRHSLSQESRRRLKIQMEQQEALVKSQQPPIDQDLIMKRIMFLSYNTNLTTVNNALSIFYVVSTTLETQATKAEADIYKKLAYSHNIIFKIMNPATGIADEVLGASVLKRYREDLHESKEMMVTASGVADEELGAFVLKRHSRIVAKKLGSVRSNNGSNSNNNNNDTKGLITVPDDHQLNGEVEITVPDDHQLNVSPFCEQLISARYGIDSNVRRCLTPSAVLQRPSIWYHDNALEYPAADKEKDTIGDLVEMPSKVVEQGMDDHVPDEIDGAKGEHVPNHVSKKCNLEFLVCKHVLNHGGNELVGEGRPLKKKMVYAE